MSSLQMPKVDSSVLSRKDKIALDLRAIINSKNVLSNPDELRPFETDGLTAYRHCLLYTSDACRRIERCRSRWSPYH